MFWRKNEEIEKWNVVAPGVLPKQQNEGLREIYLKKQHKHFCFKGTSHTGIDNPRWPDSEAFSYS
jgi:hypothetical protein